MLDVNSWLNQYISALKDTFKDRVWFVGLQGSYARGEATETSDIDVVAILDAVSTQDIISYNKMLDTLPNRELICGFFSGKDELLNWETSDLFQFYHDTKAIFGNLDLLLSKITPESVDRAIKMGACNIYHGCVHNMLCEKDEKAVTGLYKAASFVIQALTYKRTGRYVHHLQELLDTVAEKDKKIIANYIDLKRGRKGNFVQLSTDLFNWAKATI